MSYNSSALLHNITNNSDHSSSVMLYRVFRGDSSTLEKSMSPSLIIVILTSTISVGVIGNMAVVLFITSDRKLHRAPFYFILQVSVTDLCKTVFSLPFSLSVLYNEMEWIFSHRSCVIVAFASAFFTMSSLEGLIIAAIDRYISMTSPRFHSTCARGCIISFVTVFSWGVAIGLTLPPIFKQGVYIFIEEEIQCTFKHQQFRNNDTLGYVILSTCLLFACLILHWRMFRFLRAHRRMVPMYHRPATSPNWNFLGPGANRQGIINLLNGFTNGRANPPAFMNANQTFQHIGRVVTLHPFRNEHLVRVLFVSSFIFTVCWLPYLFYVYVRIAISQPYLSRRYITVATLLSHAHVALCPLVYLCSPNPIRRSIVETFRKLKDGVHGCVTTDEQSDNSQIENNEVDDNCAELEV